MFGSLTRGIRDRVLKAAIHQLASTGRASLDGVGELKYSYIKNEITVMINPKMVDEVRKYWEENHFGKEYEI